ncbi:phosphotransferase family protein [Paenibacillus tarimensis]
MRKPVIRHAETIYRGMNGRTVERIRLESDEMRILKHCGPDPHEYWIYNHILSSFPPIYPKLIGQSLDTESAADCWLLFEDLGTLDHGYNEEAAREVIRYISWWHSLPVGQLSGLPVQGLKPSYKEMASELAASVRELLTFSHTHGISPDLIRVLFKRIERESISNELVLSHGDLHTGNYAFAADGRLYILDWEHTHLNNRFWDLYHVIDLSHPLYPKTKDPLWRMRLLEFYLNETERNGTLLDKRRFIREYELFASVFSLWMLRLIDSDMARQSGPWTLEQLSGQAAETARTFQQTMDSIR